MPSDNKPWMETLTGNYDREEAYPEPWLHCTIHLNPETGEMHSDGDHRVREWIEEKIKNN